MQIIIVIALALLAGGIYLIHRFGGGVTKTPPLQVSEDNGWTTIATTPAPLPLRITAISVIFATGLAIMVGVSKSSSNPTSDMTPLFVVLVWLGSGILIRRMWQGYHDGRRKVVHFPVQVSAQGIRLGSLHIPPDRIYAITRRNGQDGRVVVVAGRGAALGVSQMAAGTLSLLTKISHTVEVEHDGQSTVLAGGLTEPQANAVATEITRRLPGFG
ncbi:hypothetical protein PY254_11690 [Rhodanobacter sp. AS-Z3]|uniref:hypothetical protein n=1 Tax=Rhodanobacter sp. AS-Z3 TaxID=3031330 RepID=UPI002478430D|nr:hypothetical protein [Rhodanobacter sp. AS-Z3]WEN13902.1 hypothetical protein PY254_11690 [Rhodanobacter sp. AS-Z3]